MRDKLTSIVDKINEQRITEVAQRLDELPPLMRAYMIGRIEGAIDALEEKKAG